MDRKEKSHDMIVYLCAFVLALSTHEHVLGLDCVVNTSQDIPGDAVNSSIRYCLKYVSNSPTTGISSITFNITDQSPPYSIKLHGPLNLTAPTTPNSQIHIIGTRNGTNPAGDHVSLLCAQPFVYYPKVAFIIEEATSATPANVSFTLVNIILDEAEPQHHYEYGLLVPGNPAFRFSVVGSDFRIGTGLMWYTNPSQDPPQQDLSTVSLSYQDTSLSVRQNISEPAIVISMPGVSLTRVNISSGTVGIKITPNGTNTTINDCVINEPTNSGLEIEGAGANIQDIQVICTDCTGSAIIVMNASGITIDGFFVDAPESAESILVIGPLCSLQNGFISVEPGTKGGHASTINVAPSAVETNIINVVANNSNGDGIVTSAPQTQILGCTIGNYSNSEGKQDDYIAEVGVRILPGANDALIKDSKILATSSYGIVADAKTTISGCTINGSVKANVLFNTSSDSSLMINTTVLRVRYQRGLIPRYVIVYAHNIDVRNSTVGDCFFQNIRSCYAFEVDQSGSLWLDNSTVRCAGTGVVTYGPTNVSNCQFESVNVGITSNNVPASVPVSIINTTVTSSGTGIHATFDNFTIVNFTASFIDIGLKLASNQPQVSNISISYANTSAISVTDRSQIFLRNINLSHSIGGIQCDSGSQCQIDGLVAVENMTGIVVHSPSLQLSNAQISSTDICVQVLDGNTSLIVNSSIHNCGGGGILVQSDQTLIKNCNLVSNFIAGIQVDYMDSSNSIQIVSTTVNGSAGDGIFSQSNVSIVDSVLINNVKSGIHLEQDTGFVIDNCFVGTTPYGTATDGNFGYGIEVGIHSSNFDVHESAIIKNTVVVGNAKGGINSLQTAIIQNSTIGVGWNEVTQPNLGDGLTIGGVDSFVTDTIISGNSRYGVYISSDNATLNNSFVGTTPSGLKSGNGQIGIMVFGSSNLLNMTISNNGFIGVLASAKMYLNGSTVFHSNDSGITLSAGSKGSIIENVKVLDSGAEGINIEDNNISIHNVDVFECRQACIQIGAYSSSSSISLSEVGNCTLDGIQIYGSGSLITSSIVGAFSTSNMPAEIGGNAIYIDGRASQTVLLNVTLGNTKLSGVSNAGIGTEIRDCFLGSTRSGILLPIQLSTVSFNTGSNNSLMSGSFVLGSEESAAVVVNAPDVSIQETTIGIAPNGVPVANNYDGVQILPLGTGCKIVDTFILGSTGTGITSFANGTNVTSSTVMNTIPSPLSRGQSELYWGTGLYFDKTAERAYIENVKSVGNDGSGIMLNGQAPIVNGGCIGMTGAASCGYQGVYQNLSFAIANRGDGITITSTAVNASVTSCIISGNNGMGINVNARHTTVMSCTLGTETDLNGRPVGVPLSARNNGSGIFISQNASHVLISSNIICNSWGIAAVEIEGTNVIVSENMIGTLPASNGTFNGTNIGNGVFINGIDSVVQSNLIKFSGRSAVRFDLRFAPSASVENSSVTDTTNGWRLAVCKGICKCISSDGSTSRVESIDCSGENLGPEFPVQWPSGVVNITMSNSNLEIVDWKTLLNQAGSMRVLDLSSNPLLDAITNATYSRFLALSDLSIDGTDLSMLQNDTFESIASQLNSLYIGHPSYEPLLNISVNLTHSGDQLAAIQWYNVSHCPRGYYSPLPLNTGLGTRTDGFCIRCPRGKKQLLPNQQLYTSCKSCAPGYVDTSGDPTVPCTQSNFQVSNDWKASVVTSTWDSKYQTDKVNFVPGIDRSTWTNERLFINYDDGGKNSSILFRLQVYKSGTDQNEHPASVFSDATSGQSDVNFTINGQWDLVLTARDLSGRNVLLANKTIVTLPDDTKNPTNGPNHKDCVHGKRTDKVPLSGHFTCDCHDTNYEGDNCEIIIETLSTKSAVLISIGGAICAVLCGFVALKIRRRWQLKTKLVSKRKQLQYLCFEEIVEDLEDFNDCIFDAIETGSEHLIPKLLERGAKASDRHTNTLQLPHGLLLAQCSRDNDKLPEGLIEVFENYLELDTQISKMLENPHYLKVFKKVLVDLVKQGRRYPDGATPVHRVVDGCRINALSEQLTIMIIEPLLQEDPELVTVRDSMGRTPAMLATLCTGARELHRQLAIIVFGRYQLMNFEAPIYRSETSVICLCRDLDHSNSQTETVVKLMRNRDAWKRELNTRNVLRHFDGIDEVHIMLANSAACIIEEYDDEDIGAIKMDIVRCNKSILDETKHKQAFDLMLEFPYAICMLRAERNLLEIIHSERYAGLPISVLGYTMRKIALAIDALHKVGIVHGDIKPRNIVRQTGGGNQYKLIDFDMSFRGSIKDNELKQETGVSNVHADARAINRSNAYACPELVRWANHNTRIGSSSSVTSQSTINGDDSYEANQNSVTLELATPEQIDIFSFGVTLYEVVTGVSLFEHSYDKLTTRAIRSILKGWTGLDSTAMNELQQLHPGDDVFALGDVLQWLLEPEPWKRPKSMSEVLGHTFFDAKHGAMRVHFLVDRIRAKLKEHSQIRDCGRVMISYSWKDAPFVLGRLAMTLAERSSGLWVDRLGGELGMGEWTRQSMERGVKGCDVVVAVLSPSYVKSTNCGFELGCASKYKKQVIPILYDLPVSEWPPLVVGTTPMTDQFINPKDPTDGKLFIDFQEQGMFNTRMHQELIPRLRTLRQQSHSVRNRSSAPTLHSTTELAPIYEDEVPNTAENPLSPKWPHRQPKNWTELISITENN